MKQKDLCFGHVWDTLREASRQHTGESLDLENRQMTITSYEQGDLEQIISLL